jgi:hypothetical protein
MVVAYFNVLSDNLPGVYKENKMSSFRMISFVLINKHGTSIIKNAGTTNLVCNCHLNVLKSEICSLIQILIMVIHYSTPIIAFHE